MPRQLYRKTRKFIKTPGPFFRDYLNKKYPAFSNEQKISQNDESVVIRHELQRCLLEKKLITNNEPVDVVFTWVNNTDSAWRERYQQASRQPMNNDIGLYANDNARFENHNELYYSIHGVLKHLEWVRHIFIVTDNQTPDWFSSLRSEKISIIDHRQIIDEKYLPTFNSHVIEAHLHRIPNLSENFIYLNDDVFVARPLPKEHFFAPNGNASIFLADKSLQAMKDKGVMTPTLFACSNCQLLLKKDYSVEIDMPLVHTYIPLKKSYFEKAWQLYGDRIQEFLANKFRSNHDLNLATFLVPYLMYLNGKSVACTEVCYYFNIRSSNAKIQYKKLLQLKDEDKQPHSFCANDFNSQEQTSHFHKDLTDFLQSYFKTH